MLFMGNLKIIIPLFFVALLIILITFTPLIQETGSLITGKAVGINNPPTAVITSPRDDEVINTNRPLIKWHYYDEENDSQVMVEIQVGEDLQLNDPKTTLWAGTRTEGQLSSILEDKNYYLRLRVKDQYNWGKWTELKRFTVDTTQKICLDNTKFYECSKELPKYCDGGFLMDKCSKCGCPANYKCLADESCEGLEKPVSEPNASEAGNMIREYKGKPINGQEKPKLSIFQRLIVFIKDLF